MTSSPSREPRFEDMEGRNYADLARLHTPRSPVRTSLTEVCCICSGVGHWSGFYSDAVFTPPVHHRKESIHNGDRPILFDSCPENRAA
jgi:hypothetical protein